MAPNQHPKRFMRETEMPIEVTDGEGICGRRSAERWVTCSSQYVWIDEISNWILPGRRRNKVGKYLRQ